MRIKPIRQVAAASIAAVLLAGGLAACGGDDEETATTPPAGQEAPADPATDGATGDTAGALTPVSYEDPFAGAREAASHMPMTADALSGGIIEAAKIKGDMKSPAADVRAGLTYLLSEHVYLAGIAVATAYATAPDSPEFELAAKAVDANSVAVADAVGGLVPDERDQFLQSWRSHVDDFVAYAVAAKGEDDAGKKKAVDNLMAYAKSQGDFFSKITNKELPAKAVEEAFVEHITLLAGAVDAFAAGKTNAYTKLKQAVAHMPMMAKTVAGGVAAAGAVEGNPDDDASELRSLLTGQLTEHVYLAGIAVFTAYTDPESVESAAFKAAADTLDKNSVELSKSVGSVSDAESEKAFLQAWRSHINDFVTYAKGAAGQDQAMKDEALTNLDAYRTAAGELFNKVTGEVIPVAAVEEELKMHVESLAGTIDAMAAALVKPA